MGKLLLRDYRALKLVTSEFSLRSHAPLWIIWPSISLSLSFFLLLVGSDLVFFCLPFSVLSPEFRWSWWKFFNPPLVVVVLALLFSMREFDLSLWKFKINSYPVNRTNPPTDTQQCTMDPRKIRYERGYLVINFYSAQILLFAYKFCSLNLEKINSSLLLSISQNRSPLGVLVFLAGLFLLAMVPPTNLGKDKGKEKIPLGMDDCSKNNISNDTKFTNSTPLPNLKLPLGSAPSKAKGKKGGCSNSKLDLTAMFKKIEAVRENGKKKKELTFVGFLVGGKKEFPRLFAKLRMDGKPLKGTISFSVLKFSWFEVSFSNLADYQSIWSNRPYHVFSQLLLIKQWYPGFDPTSESISQLDLWVRLHYLPEEFANSDALETIIEGNHVGRFLKMDPSHNSERWNMFTRFCINTDVEKMIGKGVIVPDEHLNQIKFTLWFDDFSPGCGACGKSAHTSRECPSKNDTTPTLHLTLKKPSSKNQSSENKPSSHTKNNETWSTMGKHNKVVNPSTFAIPNSSIYLSERGGINVIYESDNSDEGVQYLLENEELFFESPNLISAAADLHPYNIYKNSSNLNNEKGEASNSKMLEKIQIKEQSSQPGFLGKDPPFDENLRADNSKDKEAIMSMLHPLGEFPEAIDSSEILLEKGNSSLLLQTKKLRISRYQIPNHQQK